MALQNFSEKALAASWQPQLLAKEDGWVTWSLLHCKNLYGYLPDENSRDKYPLSGVISCPGSLGRTAVKGELPHPCKLEVYLVRFPSQENFSRELVVFATRLTCRPIGSVLLTVSSE